MSPYILKDIRQALGVEPTDDSLDAEIETLNPSEKFNLYCQWNGLLGWSGTLSEVVLELYKEK